MTPSNAAPVRTVRWKGTSTDASPQRKYRRIGLILGLILTAVVLVSVIVALLLAPLFTWKTAFVSLVIDQYRIGSLVAVPFANEDKTALAASLAHSLPTDQTTDSVHLVGFETSAAIREKLGNRLFNLPLRSKDVLVAYVRAQSMVAPPSLDADGIERTDPLNNKVCLIASDFRIEGDRPRGLVPMRELVESIGRESSTTTLIAIDFGDLRWDPRAGVIAGLVPKMLDDEFAEPQRKATGANWVVGSHDLFEYSGTYLPERRTFFARSLELGLSGAADAAPWGDGDLLVELDELLRFVSAWTSQWARQSSGGRSLQNPVVWKLGVGRVPLSSVPPNIAVVRVPTAKKKVAKDKPASDKPSQEKQEPTAPEKKAEASSPVAQPAPVPPQKSPAGPSQNPLPKKSAAVPAASDRQPALFQPASKTLRLDATRFSAGVVLTAAEKDAAKPDAGPAFPATGEPPAAAAASPTAAPSTASPPADGTPPAAAAPAPAAVPEKPPAAIPPPPPEPEVLPPNLWQLIEQQNARRKQAPAFEVRPALVDFAPHLWAELVALAGSAQLQALQNDSGSLRTNAFLDQFTADLANLSSHSNAAEAVGIRSSPIVSLQQTLAKAESKNFFEAWENAPPRFRNAIAVRNDAVVSLLAAVNLNAIFAGGSGTLPLEPATLRTAISQIARLSSIINGFPSISSSNDEPLRLDPLDDVSRSVSLLVARLNELVDLLFVNLLDSGAINQSTVSYRECSAALTLPFLSMPRRDSLLAMIRPSAQATLSGDQSSGTDAGSNETPPEDQSMLLAVGRVPFPSETPIRIQRMDLENIAVLVDSLAAIVDAAGILSDSTSRAPPEMTKTVREIADVRKACESLASFTSDEKVAIQQILRLAAKLSQLYSKAASEVDSTTISSAGFMETDRGAALLRILDPRDAENLSTVEIASIPRWAGVDAVGIVLQPIDGVALEFQRPTLIRLVFGDRDKKQVPVNATLRLRYDPADMQVRASGGGILNPNRGSILSDLPLRAEGLRLELLANRKASETDLDGRVRLRALLEIGGRTEEAELYVKLPSERTVTLSVRRTPVANAATGNGWLRSRVLMDSVASDALVQSTVQLPCLPGRVTAWELGLENEAPLPRTVSVEVYSVASSQKAGAREKDWKEATAQIVAGTSTLAKMAAIAKVELPVSQSITFLPLPPEAVAPAILPLPAPAGTPPAAAPPAPAPIPIGPDVAVLVREITAGQPPRAWLTRLCFEVEHPRTLLVPTAIWNSRERTITVEVRASDAAGKGVDLPPNGMRVSMKPLSIFPVIGRQPIEMRKSEALLTPSRPADVLVAFWNGSDRSGRAWLAIDIDGYPRAMVMAVDCSQATDGERQGAQYDWRNISFIDPIAKETLVKAPAATVGFRVAVDAPPDSFRMKNGVATSTVSLSLREDRGDPNASRDDRVVWSAAADRQVEFVRDKPVVPGTLAVMTTVQDWKINTSGEGFENIDILAQARLSIPGVQQPLADQRQMVFDARAPVVEAPPSMNVSVGKPLVVPVRVMDDPRESFAAAATKHLPGVSGVDRVEWGIDTKGNGSAEAWQPAVSLGGGAYELRVVTTTLPPGKQTLLLVRAFDRAGLSDPPDRVWLTAAAVVARNCIEGRVILNGKGEAGVLVTADGPSAPKPIKTDKEGKFKFSDVDAGEYKLQATGPIRNQNYRSEIVPVVVSPPPAPPASALLPLK